MSTSSRDDISEHEVVILDRESNVSTTQEIIDAVKKEIKSSCENNVSQLLMTLTSGMYAVNFMTTPGKNAAVYYLSVVLSSLIFIDVIILLILTCYRKKKFKTEGGKCPAKTMKKAKRLQKVNRGFSILLIVLQFLFTIVAGISVSEVMDDDDHHSNHTTTVPMETSTIGEYVVNNTSG